MKQKILFVDKEFFKEKPLYNLVSHKKKLFKKKTESYILQEFNADFYI